MVWLGIIKSETASHLFGPFHHQVLEALELNYKIIIQGLLLYQSKSRIK